MTLVWHKGPPPHVGWWNASLMRDNLMAWRWWDGEHWSAAAAPHNTAEEAARFAAWPAGREQYIEWTEYWPEGARVPRINGTPEPERIWHSGPPPHVGWWNASTAKNTRMWRWWDGRCWSEPAYPEDSPPYAGLYAARPGRLDKPTEWSDYWPEGARVPRTEGSPAICPQLDRREA